MTFMPTDEPVLANLIDFRSICIERTSCLKFVFAPSTWTLSPCRSAFSTSITATLIFVKKWLTLPARSLRTGLLIAVRFTARLIGALRATFLTAVLLTGLLIGFLTAAFLTRRTAPLAGAFALFIVLALLEVAVLRLATID